MHRVAGWAFIRIFHLFTQPASQVSSLLYHCIVSLHLLTHSFLLSEIVTIAQRLLGSATLCLLAVSHDEPNKATRLGSIYLTWNAARWICMYSSQLDAESILKKQPVNKWVGSYWITFSRVVLFSIVEISDDRMQHKTQNK